MQSFFACFRLFSYLSEVAFRLFHCFSTKGTLCFLFCSSSQSASIPHGGDLPVHAPAAVSFSAILPALPGCHFLLSRCSFLKFKTSRCSRCVPFCSPDHPISFCDLRPALVSPIPSADYIPVFFPALSDQILWMPSSCFMDTLVSGPRYFQLRYGTKSIAEDVVSPHPYADIHPNAGTVGSSFRKSFAKSSNASHSNLRLLYLSIRYHPYFPI